MKKLILLSISILLAAACGSPAANSASRSTATNTNVNSVATPNENAYVRASNSELGNLTPSGKAAREFVGKTATEAKLWQNKTVDLRLRTLMGSDYATMKKFWNTETPIKKYGDYLMMTGCEKHNCSDNQYVIFMDMGEGNINVVHIEKGKMKGWKANGDIALPPPFANDLAAIRSR